MIAYITVFLATERTKEEDSCPHGVTFSRDRQKITIYLNKSVLQF